MHYLNGRPAKQGDIVIGKNYNGTLFTGVVIKTHPGNTACNLDLILLSGNGSTTVASKEVLHTQDALNPAAFTNTPRDFELENGKALAGQVLEHLHAMGSFAGVNGYSESAVIPVSFRDANWIVTFKVEKAPPPIPAAIAAQDDAPPAESGNDKP